MTALAVLARSPAMALAGTAVVYNLPTQVDGITETVAPGAFHNLGDPNILFVDGHQPERLLARSGAGTLQLTDRPDRLEYRAQLPDTALGRDVWRLTEQGAYGGASVGMMVEEEKLETGPEGRVLRTITRALLHHISPVGAPAYRDTAVQTAQAPTGRILIR